MNISTIADMIRSDPSIQADVPAFLKRMNAQDIKRVEQVRIEVEDVVTMLSMAELSGGEATERNVKDALALLAAEPLHKEADERFEKLRAAIASGEAKNTADIVSTFAEAQ